MDVGNYLEPLTISPLTILEVETRATPLYCQNEHPLHL